MSIDLKQVERDLEQTLGRSCAIVKTAQLTGGCIHQTMALYTQDQGFFIKWNSLKKAPLFQTEEQGLAALRKAKTPTPEVIRVGQTDEHAYLIQELIEAGTPARHYWVNFGDLLAKQHQQQAEHYGAFEDNYIGRLYQSNANHPDWLTFFVEQRLEPMIKRAVKEQLLPSNTQKRFLKLFDKLDTLVPKEPPSLLHGDLWSGNVLCGSEGLAVLIDPAVYYGHREMEISFTQLFGRFPTSFYRAYNKVWPLQDGWEERVHLHNLYPLLVHLNLFGEEYLSQIRQALMYYI